MSLVALTLAGCGSDEPAMSVLEVKTDPVTVVLVSAPADQGMQALGGGRLAVVGGCLGAGDSVVIWPHGTKITSDDPLEIEVPNLGTFGVGDDVRIGGGYIHEPPQDPATRRLKVGDVEVPAECVKHSVFAAAPT